MRRNAVVSLGAALLVSCSLSTASDARPAHGTGRVLSAWGADAPRVVSDGQGYTLAAFVTLDATYSAPTDLTNKWRIAVTDRGPNALQWTPEQVVSGYGAVPTRYQQLPNIPHTIAVGLAPRSGAAVVAWVQAVAGTKRVQIAARASRSAGFGTPTTLPADSQCGTLDRFQGLEIAFDGSGGHLMLQAVCVSGGVYRTYVPLSSSGTPGTPTVGVFAGERSGSLVRVGSETHSITINRFNGKVMDYPLGPTGIDDATGVTLTDATVGLVSTGTNTGLNAVAAGDRIIAGFRGTDGGETKIGVVVEQSGTPNPVVWFDPVPGEIAFDPTVAVSPNGTIAATWLEGGQAWAAYQRPGQSWTTPVAVSDPTGDGLLQSSVRVVATDSAVHALWNTQETVSGVTTFTVWSSVADFTAPSSAFTPPQVTMSNGIYASVAGVTNGAARAVATRAGGSLIYPVEDNDLVIGDARTPALTLTGLTSEAGKPGVIRIAVTLDGEPVPDGSVVLAGAFSAVRLLDAAGRAEIPVPATLSPGQHTVFVAFNSDNGLIASAARTFTYTVGKATPTVKAKVTKEPTPQAGGSLKVTVATVLGNRPTGKVIVTLTKGGAKVKVKGTLRKGRVKVDLPRLASGRWKGTASYAGDSITDKGKDSFTLKT